MPGRRGSTRRAWQKEPFAQDDCLVNGKSDQSLQSYLAGTPGGRFNDIEGLGLQELHPFRSSATGPVRYLGSSQGALPVNGRMGRVHQTGLRSIVNSRPTAGRA